MTCVNGRVPVYAYRIYLGDTASIYQFQKSTLETRNMYTAGVLPGSPPIGDVRAGVTYGPVSELEGSLIVPDPSNVRKGVPTDATTGTAELTAEDILEAIELSANPVAERLRNVSTVQTTGNQISSLNPLP
jgi:hypothetical protein